eukprot:scaffold2305_cov216-Chaetoceros_neogracile.AAC.2
MAGYYYDRIIVLIMVKVCEYLEAMEDWQVLVMVVGRLDVGSVDRGSVDRLLWLFLCLCRETYRRREEEESRRERE